MADVALNLLDRVKIASPCSARWEDMVGDDKVRHCAQCNLKVHNFGAMTRDEAESLLRAHFGDDGSRADQRLCGGWYKRADGKAIPRDCPRGLAAIRTRARKAVARLATYLGLATATGALSACHREDEVQTGGVVAIQQPQDSGGPSAEHVGEQPEAHK